MNKSLIIRKLYKALCIYETSREDYYKYLETLLVWLSGVKKNEINEQVIIIIRGLNKLGTEATHYMVKASIFQAIDLVK